MNQVYHPQAALEAATLMPGYFHAHASWGAYVGRQELHLALRLDTLRCMSPTVFRVGPYRFHFFSLEEEKSHVHVTCPDGEAKFWLEPAISLAASTGLSNKQLNDIHRIVESRRDEITEAWNEHFKA